MDLKATTHLPESTLLAIGRIIVRFSYIEWLLGRTIAEIMGIPPAEGRILTVRMLLRSKLDTLQLFSILHGWSETQITAFNDLRQCIEDAQVGRNDLAHCVYAVDESWSPHLVKYRGGKDDRNRISGAPTPITPEKLSEFEENTDHAAAILDAWWDRFGDALIALRNKPS